MKTAGFVRKVDELGRVVLPQEFRAKLGINKKEKLEMYKKQDTILIGKVDDEDIKDMGGVSSISRKIDELARIVIPKEWRDELDIKFKVPVEIALNKNMITVKKYNPYCIFCGEENKLNEYKEKRVCNKCIDKLSEIKK